MANLNMANMNTLFRKFYLLAVVMMAANIFVVNDVKAMDQLENMDEKIILDENIPVTNADQRQFIRKVEMWRSLHTEQQGALPLKNLFFLF